MPVLSIDGLKQSQGSWLVGFWSADRHGTQHRRERVSARVLASGRLTARLLALAVLAAGFGWSVGAAPALADTTINVNTTFDPTTPQAGTCSLREGPDTRFVRRVWCEPDAGRADGDWWTDRGW
jgi:hypothetical protein